MVLHDQHQRVAHVLHHALALILGEGRAVGVVGDRARDEGGLRERQEAALERRERGDVGLVRVHHALRRAAVHVGHVDRAVDGKGGGLDARQLLVPRVNDVPLEVDWNRTAGSASGAIIPSRKQRGTGTDSR